MALVSLCTGLRTQSVTSDTAQIALDSEAISFVDTFYGSEVPGLTSDGWMTCNVVSPSSNCDVNC